MLRAQQERGPAVRDKVLLTVTFASCVVAACTRGALELMVGKQAAYAVQALAVVAFVVVVLVARGTTRQGQARRAWTVYTFLLVAMLSATYVTIFKGNPSAWTYVIVMTFFVLTILVLSSREIERAGDVPVAFWLGISGLSSVVVGLLQQRNIFLDLFPGSDLTSMDGMVRPSAMTGSYLHYPLFVAMLVFVFLEFARARNRVVHGMVAGLFVVAIVLSFSRSGVMILALGVLSYVFTARSVSTRLRYAYWASGVLLVSVLALSGTVYGDRIFSMVSPDASGNDGRITKWFGAVELWADSPLLIGGWTGLYTNVTENFGGGSVGVVESGLLQQLVSFGALGAILFYVVMGFAVVAVDPAHPWLRAGLVGAILETVIYQSIEVIPFMVMFAIVPFISTYLLRGGGAMAREASSRGQESCRRENANG
jgi:hypothetical protein